MGAKVMSVWLWVRVWIQSVLRSLALVQPDTKLREGEKKQRGLDMSGSRFNQNRKCSDLASSQLPTVLCFEF